jgi:hypothetical protein
VDRFADKRSLEKYFRAFSLLLVVLLGMVCLAAMMLSQWNSLHQDDRILPASLLAVSTEDYSGSRPVSRAQVIGLAIIGDTMRDTGFQSGDLTARLASVTAELLSPVPSATANLAHTATAISTGTPSSKISPHPTLAQTQLPPTTQPPSASNTPATTQAPSASNTPAASPTFPSITATSAPATSTAGPVAHPTNTRSPAPSTPFPPNPTPQSTRTFQPWPTHWSWPTPKPWPTHWSWPTSPPRPTSPPKPTPHPKKTKKPKAKFSSNAGPVYMSIFSGSSLPAGIVQRAGPVNASSAALISLKPLSTFFLQLAELIGRACHFFKASAAGLYPPGL